MILFPFPVRQLAFAGTSLLLPLASASAFTTSIGTPHFVDGQAVGSGTFLGAVSGQPAPFDGFNGSGDVAGPDFTASWTFTYAPQPLGIGAASLTMGVWDGDSAASGLQVASLLFDGIDLTVSANAAFESALGITGQYRIYSIPIPPVFLTNLLDGSASVSLTLQGPGLGVLGELPNNGAGLDFASLEIIPVPEPSGILLTGAAGGMMLFTRRRTTPKA